MWKQLSLIVLISVLSISLWAQEKESFAAPAEQPSTFRVGTGAATLFKPYKGFDRDCFAVPLVFYEDQKLTVFGPMAAYSFFGEENRWAVQALARGRFEGYDSDDSDYLRGMSDRDWSLELGLRYINDLDFAVMSLDFTHDVLDEHNGYEFRFTLRKLFRNLLNIKSLNLTPTAGINWRSSDLNTYYYGVRDSEAIAGRPAYKAGGSVDYLTGAQLTYKLSDQWSLLSIVDVEWLGSEITDSPIVDKDYYATLLLGAMVEF